MRRAAFYPLAGCALAGMLCLFAQAPLSRDGYRAAYRAWREGDPSLERDAGAAGAALTPRAAKAADAAGAYGASRLAFLEDAASQHTQNLQWLQEAAVQPLPDLSAAPELLRFTNREIGVVGGSVANLAKDPDPAIRLVYQASQRELAALQALNTAITARQAAEETEEKAAAAAEQARSKAMEQYPQVASALAQSAALMKQEATVWAAYYPALAEGSRTISAAATPPAVSAVRTVSPAPTASNAAAAPAAPTAPASSSPASAASPSLASVASPAPASAASPAPASTALRAPAPDLQGEPAPPPLRTPSITPLPLSRYVGVWAFQAGGPFHGNEPEFVDFSVHEENGHAEGTFYARFKLPPGSTDDPVLHFDFSGDLRAIRNQRFELKTSEGTKGIVDLIPGGPFNVLEVNFETEIKPGKVHQGDVLLVKQ